MLSSGEFKLLSMLVAELPPHLRSVAESQFAEYNLVQREADGRALNFYKVGVLSKAPLPVLPRFQSEVDEAPLVRINMQIAECTPLHATLTAVRGRVFCASFSSSVPEAFENEPRIIRVVHSWESNFPANGVA